MGFQYYAKLGTTKLVNPPDDDFSITELLNGLPNFDYVIQNIAANRTAISTKLTEDFQICRVSDDLVLLTGRIDSDKIQYFSENEANPDRIRLPGFASWVDLAHTLFKRLPNPAGTEQDADMVYDLDASGPTWTDETNDAKSAAVNDVDLTFGGVNDAFYVGKNETFSVVKIKYSTKGIQAANTTVVKEYWNGSAWVTVDCLCESREFTKDAGTYFLIISTKPTNWAKTTPADVAGCPDSKDRYWIRFRITAGSYSTPPQLDRLWLADTDIYRVQFDNIAADTILGYVLDGTGYSEDAVDQCPADLISMRMEYENRLRCVFGIAKALTWDDGGDKKVYDCWITTDKKVHFKQQRGQTIKQDYTKFTKEDPNSHLGFVGTDHLDFDAYRNEDCYLYRDYGVDFFEDFLEGKEHKVNIKAINIGAGDYGYFWQLSNDIDDIHGLLSANKTFIAMCIVNDGSDKISLREGYNGGIFQSSYTITEDTWYYLTITKFETSLTCKIYSDSARANLLSTLSRTLHADHKFRYLFGCNTDNLPSAHVCTLDIENLTLWRDISPILTMLDNAEDYQGIWNRIFGLGSFEGINQRRAIVENQASQDSYSLREIPFKDMRFSHATSLKELIQKHLTNSKAPLTEVSCEIETKYWLDNSLAVGDEVVVDQPSWNVSAQTYRIMRAVIGPSRTTLDLGIQQIHLENIRSHLQDQLNVDDIWMKGSGNVYQESLEVLSSISAPGLQRFYVSLQMEAINRAYLRYKVEPWTKVSDMDVLPTAEPAVPWTKHGTELAEITNATGGAGTGYLHLNDDLDAGYIFYSHPWAANIDGKGYVVKTRLQVISSSNEQGSISVMGNDAKCDWFLDFYTDRIILYPDEIHAGMTYMMDTTNDYHVYMITVNGNDIKVYVDGTLRIDGTGEYDASSCTFVSPLSLYFGCGIYMNATTQGRVRFDYAKYFEGGITDPDNFTLKVEIGKEGETLTEVDGSPATLDQTKLNITSALRAVGKDAWFVVQFTPNQEQYNIFSSIFCETFLYSK